MKRFFRTSRIDKRLRSAAIFFGVVVLYALLRAVPPVSRVFAYGEHIVLVAGTAVGSVIARATTSEDSLTAQLDICTNEVRMVTAQDALLRQELRNVDELEALLGYTRIAAHPMIAARIIERSLPEAGLVVIDKGTSDGIVVGSAVVVGDGQLFGVVATANTITSTIRITHNAQSKIPATILGRTRTIGLVEGQEGSVLHMAYIPEDTTIDVGSVVATSGLDGALPPNIVVGIVTSVSRQDTAPFLDALVEPLFDAREWTNVLVVRN